MEKSRPQRHRQFSQIRYETSHRSTLSASRFNNIDSSHQNFNQSHIRKLNYGQNSHRKPVNPRLQPTRKNQQIKPSNLSKSFHDFKESDPNKRKRNRSSKLLCVGCFNKELCLHKSKRKHHEQQLQKSRYNINQSLINENDSYHKLMRSRYDQQYHNTNEFNLKKIREHERAKREQQQAREREIQSAKMMESQNRKMQEKKQQDILHKRNHFRMELDKQIAERRQKKITEQRERQEDLINQTLLNTIEPQRQKYRQQISDRYRQQLINQINDKKENKEHERREEIRKNRQLQIQTMQLAAEQDRIKLERQKYRRQLKAQEQQWIQQRAQDRTEKQRRKRAQEQIQKQQYEEAANFEYAKREQLKKNQLDNYLVDLKKQMENDKRKKLEEYRIRNEPTTVSFYEERRVRPEKECDSCEKRYPESYLTTLNVENYQIYE